jgi:hypothetical protein
LGSGLLKVSETAKIVLDLLLASGLALAETLRRVSRGYQGGGDM